MSFRAKKWTSVQVGISTGTRPAGLRILAGMSTGEPLAGPRAAAASMHGDGDISSSVSPSSAVDLERKLTSQLSLMYRPSLPIYSTRSQESFALDFFWDIEEMRIDAAVALPLSFVTAVLAHSEWTIEGSSAAVAQYGAQEIQWFWSNAVGLVQDDGYAWGWSPGELTWDVKDGLLCQSAFQTFNPRDADPMIRNGKPVGIVVRNVDGGDLYLHAWRDDVPNKGFWYAHRSRHGRRHGRSQIRPAWRHWRRLSGRDGGEEIIDLGVYRNGVGDTVVRHPNEPYRARDGRTSAFAESGVTHTRDEARMIAENRKAGAGIAISSERDSSGNPRWDIEVLEAKAQVDKLVSYVEYLERKCSKAIGVPPELFEAAQTGSGYSGRAIPLQAFLVSQQRPLDDLTRAWVEQIGMPAVKWNFGQDAWIRVTPVPLFESYRKAAWDSPSGQQSPMVQGGFQPPGQPDAGMPDDGGGEPAMLSTEFELCEV